MQFLASSSADYLHNFQKSKQSLWHFYVLNSEKSLLKSLKVSVKMIATSALRRISSATRLLNNRNIIPVNSSLGNQIWSQNTPTSLELLPNRGQLLSFSTSSKLRCEAKSDVQKKIDAMINESSVVVFMKGVPAQPRCGFYLRWYGIPT